MPGFCGKCLTNYKGSLEEHVANLHILDFPQTAGYIAYLEKRIEALENKINTQKLNLTRKKAS
jgi:hypothetical protein